MVPSALIPWLDPELIITTAGPWALVVVCLIVFAETGLLVGFLLPGDTLLLISGLLTHTSLVFGLNIWWVGLLIAAAAFLGGECGYLIGHKFGPALFERKESGLFSRANVERTNHFFARFGGLSVILARFVPILRTFVPVAAGIGHMNYKKYSLYNLIGAGIWGFGLTFFGFLIGYIPPVAVFVENYIDVILLAAVTLTLIPTLWHYFRSSQKAKRAVRAGVAPLTDHEAMLDQAFFDNDRSNDPPVG